MTGRAQEKVVVMTLINVDVQDGEVVIIDERGDESFGCHSASRF